MYFTIQFNHQLFCWTVEIKDVRPGLVLPSELSARELFVFQQLPKSDLSLRQILA